MIAVVGPLASLAIGIACWLIGLGIGPSSPIVAVELDYLGISNVLIGVFNLIPGFPLDGGRVLRSLLWALTGDVRRAMRWTLRVSYVIAVAFILAGIWRFFAGNFLFGVWLGFIGWFLLIAANAANRDVAMRSLFRDLTVRAAMSEHPIAVRANLTLDRLVYDHFFPEGQRAAGVIQLGELIGLVTLSDARTWPREQWPTIPVSYAMVPVSRLSMVSPDERLAEAIRVLADRDINQVPVVRENTLVGMLSRDAVLRYLERHHIGHDDVHIERLRLPAEPTDDEREGNEQPHRPLPLPRAS